MEPRQPWSAPTAEYWAPTGEHPAEAACREPVRALTRTRHRTYSAKQAHGRDGAAGYDLRHDGIRSSPPPGGVAAVVVGDETAGVDRSGLSDGRSGTGYAAVYADAGVSGLGSRRLDRQPGYWTHLFGGDGPR